MILLQQKLKLLVHKYKCANETHHYNTHNRSTALCPALSRWADTRKTIHPLTPIIIKHPLSTFSIYYDPQHPPCSHAWQSFSITALQVLFGLPLGLEPLFHTTHISSPNYNLPFATHAHTITTCFAEIAKLCHLFLTSLSTHHLEICLLP